MHHLYPTSTGDPLCPLGFHPQVRWPTRCKRCFRDYKDHKDHGGKKSTKDTTNSSPSLSIWEPTTGRSSASPESKRSWASTSNLAKEEANGTLERVESSASAWCSATDISSGEVTTVTVKPPRPKTYAGSQSDSLKFRRYSVDGNLPSERLEIKGVIDRTNGTSSDNDAEYTIQEAEKLRAQLGDMRARCERLEKEKADILLRRLSAMDSASSKPGADVLKLQKTVKELQTRNDGLTEERGSLAARVKSLERELGVRGGRKGERNGEELRGKLKAAETLCESLMDENEDMKKEIRELEEEIYEMQDNFREEQADEYTTIRKNLEQSNKNCRILSFKLRKIERKAEQLEADKIDLEKRYDQIKRTEEILKKVGAEYKNRSTKRPAEFSGKVQLRKLLDGMEKELGDVIGAMLGMLEGRELGIPATPNFKYDKLNKEHELLKERLDKALKDLDLEKEAKKTKPPTTNGFDTAAAAAPKAEELANLRKRLEESQTSRDLERKSWDGDKLKLLEEKEKLKSKLLSLSADKLKVYNEVVQLKKDLEAAKDSKKDSARMETLVSDLRKDLERERERAKQLQDEAAALGEKETRLAKCLTTAETAKVQLENDLKQTKLELENARASKSARIAEVTAELSSANRERDKLRNQLEREKLSKDAEIASLRKKNLLLEKAGLNSKKMEDLKQAYEEKITNLENDKTKQVQKLEELNTKYEQLNESRLQIEKENQLMNGQLIDHKQDYLTLQAELQEVRQLNKTKEAEWTTLRNRLEEQLRGYEKTANTLSQEDLREENLRLKKESISMSQQIEDLRKANDDLSSKLQDFTHVAKIQRNFSADSSAMESELRKARNAAANAEKVRKADLAQCKLRYEQRIAAIGDEIKPIQAQVTRYKRERDTYKQMLEGAQKTIGELKSVRPRRQSTTSTGKSSEDEELSAGNSILMEQRITKMEDELSEAKLEASKLKTELASEKSAWEIKLSEMRSHINELEEERLLASGRTKMPGLKVRMELAWQKEREDQQRLLQETATLARDLRQTLFEVERERDKERLENKRKQDQLKKTFDEEKDENKKKLVELQCDLLELRDAHAKLRTSNEKMRREKERHEREREDLRGLLASKRRLEQAEARNLNILLQQVDDLMRLFPEANGDAAPTPDNYTPTPPRRLKGPKSRESSPLLDTKDDSRGNSAVPSGKTEKLEYTIKKLMEVAKELQESKRTADESASRAKKMGKRSSSIDADNGKAATTGSRSKASLKRKSLSLEQTSGRAEQSIWGNNSNVSSLQSLNGSEVDGRHYSLQRDSSIESHLSSESTKSEILRHDKKHSKGIIRKITTKLTKSASVDDPNSSFESSLQTSGSEVSIADITKKEKKNLKKKLSNMFKRGSKSNGLDKKCDSKDNSRPSSRTSTASAATSKR